MLHVDEGLLNAYLDGAFPPGDADGVEIETHLASCADCRARLEEARELQDRARDVLRHATPADVRVPPFEALRARSRETHDGAPAHGVAEDSVRRRLARSPVRLAWAASVVLAVSAGWMANELARRDAIGSDAVQDAIDDPRAEAERRAAPSRERGAGDAAEAGPRLAQADSPSRPTAVPAVPTVPSGETVPLTRTAEKVFDSDTAREALPAVADRLRRQAANQAQAQLELESITIPSATPADTTSAVVTRTTYSANDVIALDRMPPALADGRALAGHLALLNDYAAVVRSGLWSLATPMQVAAALGREPAGVMNLRRVTTETAVVNGRVLVRQRYALEDGTPIELIQRPDVQAPPRAGMAAFRERSAELPAAGVAFNKLDESNPPFQGESVVAVSRSGLVLLVKGPVPENSLRDITTRIR